MDKTNIHDNDGDEKASKNEEDSDIIQVRHGFVEQAYDGAGDPGGDDVGDEDVPWFQDIVGMLEGVHLHNGVGLDLG